MCNALRLYFRRENTVRRYIYIGIHDFHHIKTYVFKQNISSRLAFNEFLSEIQSGLKSVLQTNYLPDIHFQFSIFNFK